MKVKKLDFLKLGMGMIITALLLWLMFSRGYHWYYIVMEMIVIFWLVQFLSFTRGYENTWLFLFGLLALPMFNILYSMKIVNLSFNSWHTPFGFFLMIFIAITLINFEEIGLGILARMIWRKQKGKIEFEIKHEVREYQDIKRTIVK